MVNTRLEEIVVEVDQQNFLRLETDIFHMIDPLELPVKEEISRIFMLRERWAIPFFNQTFTAGLHANERAVHIECFIRMQCKYEHSLLD